jgi:CheY-like chemotaxis protein
MSDAQDSKAEADGLGSPEKEEQEPRARRRRILLAEDDAAFCALLQEAFARDGYDVVAVRDGTELLERLGGLSFGSSEAETFDVVVSDVRMPGWTGLNVLVTMGRAESSPPPVVLITAFGDERLHEQAMKAGAIAVLDKPFEIDDLRAIVNRLWTLEP